MAVTPNLCRLKQRSQRTLERRPQARCRFSSVREWPPITEPELLERMALDDEGFAAFFNPLIAAWPRREFDPEAFTRALGYPWERPAGSYVLRGADVSPLEDIAPENRRTVVCALTDDRHPILSFGAYAAPSRLTMKFAHFA